MGGLRQVPVDEAIEQAQEKQAYERGRERHRRNQKAEPGGPKDDRYGDLSPREKEAYKKGYRGE